MDVVSKKIKLRYETKEIGELDIHLRTLKNKNQFADNDGAAKKLGISSAQWPLFGVVWDSGLVLAHHMSTFDIKSKRILEVGCGIALASLVLNARGADITVTDYHPEVEAFLQENVALNKGASIPFVLADWAHQDTELGNFDLIIGSDLLYEFEHIGLLSRFIEEHTRDECEVLIVDPNRGQQNKFTKAMESLDFSHSQISPGEVEYLDEPFKGIIHSYKKNH